MLMHDGLARTIVKFEDGLQACHRPEDRTLVRNYLAALAPILAQAVLGKDVLRELPTVERMFGHSWLHDVGPFIDALTEWRRFRREYEEFSLSGMTVNERLFATSLKDEFDQACAANDREAARRVLKSVYLSDSDIWRILSDLM